jgi:3D (Asp-Asp-Asp) domain-containing protein
MQTDGTTRNAGTATAVRVALVFAKVLCAFAVLMLMATVVIAGTRNGSSAKIIVRVDGQTWEWVSSQPTVGGALKEAGIVLNAKDRVQPGLNVKLGPGMHVSVQRIEEKVIYKKETVPFKTVAKFNPKITNQVVVQQGQAGEKEIQYLYRYRDGVKAAEKIIGSSITKQPVTRIVAVPHPTMLASRGGQYLRHIQMVATAYAPFHCGGSSSGHCALGFQAGKGVAAVDPRLIPLGTKLYIEGYGEALAADTGGAIKGSRIDLCYDSYDEAMHFGRRTVTVWILE